MSFLYPDHHLEWLSFSPKLRKPAGPKKPPKLLGGKEGNKGQCRSEMHEKKKCKASSGLRTGDRQARGALPAAFLKLLSSPHQRVKTVLINHPQ